MHGLWLLCLFSCLSRWLRCPLLSHDSQIHTDRLAHPKRGHHRQEHSLWQQSAWVQGLILLQGLERSSNSSSIRWA